MSKALVIAEHHLNQLSLSTACVLRAAFQITKEVDVLLVCEEDHLSQKIAHYEGIKTVFVVQHPCFLHILAEDIALAIKPLLKDYTHIFTGATTFGKNVMPRIAANLNVAQISDITAIVDENIFIRPIYAGNAYEKIRSKDKVIIATIRPTAFESVSISTQLAEIKMMAADFTPFNKIKFKSESSSVSSRPELTTASIVVAGGRGLKNAENFKKLEILADKLGGAVGASRAAVDAGFAPNDFQVGQTGKVVAPQLYIALGISGATQHLAGMKESKIIVAINKDSDAPIFQIADYGLVGDLMTILPELEKALNENEINF